MPQACLTISGNYAAPSAVNAYTFYYYDGGDGNATNVAVNSGYAAQTNDFGIYRFSVVISAGTGSFADNITVRSGGNSAQTHLDFGKGAPTQ